MIDAQEIEEWKAWQERLHARARLGGWVSRTFNGEVDDLEQAQGAILAGVDLARIAVPKLMAERDELVAELARLRQAMEQQTPSPGGGVARSAGTGGGVMASSRLHNLRPWLRDGIWLFLGMSAYGPRWFAAVALACWIAHAFLVARTTPP